MSINHIVIKKELDAYFKALSCNSINLNGTTLVPAPLPVRQFATTYTTPASTVVTSFTNLYYTSDSNELRMRGRLNLAYNGSSPPLNQVTLVFVMPNEFKDSFQTGVTPIFNGYAVQQYPFDDSDTNGLLNQVLLAGNGEVACWYSFGVGLATAKNFTLTYDVSLIKNI